MAWRYDDEDCLVRDVIGGDPTCDRVVCWVNGAFNHGPLLAMAPRIEACLRRYVERFGCSSRGCETCLEMASVLRDLDEARAKGGP